MTLIVGVKVPEGIAVAADSRVTEHPSDMPGVMIAADDAVKMRRIPAVGSMWIAFHGNLAGAEYSSAQLKWHIGSLAMLRCWTRSRSSLSYLNAFRSGAVARLRLRC